ncbi:hypothetical protein BDY24DRAFT_441567 [Mrakia frigida]|uniref:ubiquitin-protein ligase TUL1 n=1 Tax=Mrakia frigida TaxID=29902 RepID=UPI003FCC1A3E
MSAPPPPLPFALRPRPPSLFGQPPAPTTQQPPPSLSSLIFFLLLLTLMNSGPAVQPIANGEGGAELAWVPSRARLDRRIGELEGWKGWVDNGTGRGNYSWELPSPSPHRLLSSLLPPSSSSSSLLPNNHPPTLYPRNITGFLRHSFSHTFNLSDPTSNRTSTSFLNSHLLNHVDWKKDPIFNAKPLLPRLNETIELSNSNSTRSLPIRRATTTNTTDVDVLWRDELASTSMRSGGFPWLPPLLPDGSLVEGYEVEKGMEVAWTVKEGWWGKRNNERLGQGLDQEEGWKREWGAVKGTMDFTSEWSGQTQSYTIQGFHELKTGTIYLLGSSNSSIIDLRLLPSFFPRHSLAWNSTTRFVTRALEERIDVLREEFERGLPTGGSGEQEESISAYTTCPLQIVLRLAPLPHHITLEDVSLAEAELLYPTGLPVKTWEVKLEQAAWWSWECGLAGVLEGGEGIRSNTFWKMSTDYSFLSLLASFTTVVLLVRQMERTRTPSQLSKVALPTIAMQIVLDGWSFAAHLLVGIVIDNESSLALIAPGFVSGIGFAMFGPRFCMAISRSQAHEHAPRPTPRPAPPPTTVAVAVPPPPATLPLPASAPTEPSPQVMPGALLSPPTPAPAAPVAAAPALVPVTGAAAAAVPRAPPMPPSFFENAGPQPIVALIVLFLFLLQTDVLPFVLPFVIFLFYLFWIPQIVRNAERGTKGAFSWWYILGTTAGRCWPLGYFWGGWGGRENVMFLERSNWLPAILISQSIQLLFLAGQDFISPTFFLPARFAPPPPYNYHLLLPRKGDVEGGKGWEMGDCSICMEPIVRDDLVEAGGEGLGGLGGGGRKSWAVAPCQHAFHSACLEPWLAIKTACPECRAPLPPM